MANNIRGLSIEISADATSFNKEMKEAQKVVKATQTDLTTLQKSLELEYSEDKFIQAQQVAQDAIDTTAGKADVLRERLEYLEQSGQIDTSHYRQVQSDLQKAELQGLQLQQQLEKINQIKLDHLSKQVTDVGDKIQKVGKALTPLSIAAAGTITALGTLGVKTANTGAEIDDLSLRLGISAEKVQEYQYVTAQAGVEWSVFEKGLIKARAAILDLSNGTINNASKALQTLGLDINDFESKEAMFDGIISALSNMEDKTLQASYANEIFGDKVANQMLPYLNAGTDAINQFKSEFEMIGALSNEQVANLAALDDALYLLKQSLANVGSQIGASLAPLIKSMATTLQNDVIPKLQQLANWFNSLSLGQQKFALAALLVVAALAPLTVGIGKLVTAVGSIIKVLPKLSAGLSTLAAHPIILIVAAVAAIILLLYTRCETFRESINNLVQVLGSALQPILSVVMQLLNGVMEAISPIIELLGQLLAIVVNLVSSGLQMIVDIIAQIFDALSPLIDIMLSMIDIVLTPLKARLALLLGILQPLLSVALIPLQLTLKALQIPLQMLGQLLAWLAPLFNIFASMVQGAFGIVLDVINLVLGKVEDAINWCIAKINGLIDGVNKSLGWLGVNLGRIDDVSLKIDTSFNNSSKDSGLSIDSTPPTLAPDQTYDQVGGNGTLGNDYNYDYSTTNKTQNITITIQNYASEVDVDDLVRQINTKLVEVM